MRGDGSLRGGLGLQGGEGNRGGWTRNQGEERNDDDWCADGASVMARMVCLGVGYEDGEMYGSRSGGEGSFRPTQAHSGNFASRLRGRSPPFVRPRLKMGILVLR